MTDKFIVDRTRRHRNRDVDRAILRTRERLSKRVGHPDLNRDMLKLHARSLIRAAPAIPLLIIVISLLGLNAGMDRSAVGWALFAVLCYLPVYILARHIRYTDRNAVALAHMHHWLLGGHFASGLGWAAFVLLPCAVCTGGQFPILQAAILLGVIAGTALATASLGGALIATFAMPVCVYAFVNGGLGVPAYAVMALLLALSLPFFTYVARFRNHAMFTLLSFRSEKDDLIAELETAKAMSDEARLRAEEANLAKSRFLATMSHELRTPLNAILGFSEVMANEVLGRMGNDTYRGYARDVHESGTHLLDLINEILDLSRIEAGRYILNEEPLHLIEVVEECRRMMALKARDKDIGIITEAEPQLPRLLADERAVRQMVLNLLSNAIKFSPSGAKIRIRVGWTAGGGQYIGVRDWGPGIAQEEMAVVMSAFGQGSIAIKSAEQGAGLGLPIVQGLARLHGGSLKLHSKLRQGVDAVVAFPQARVMEELPAMPTRRMAAGS